MWLSMIPGGRMAKTAELKGVSFLLSYLRVDETVRGFLYANRSLDLCVPRQ